MITQSSNYFVHMTGSHFVVLIFILCLYFSLIWVSSYLFLIPKPQNTSWEDVKLRHLTDKWCWASFQDLLVTCVFYVDECLFRSVWFLCLSFNWIICGVFLGFFLATTELYEFFMYYVHINPLIIVNIFFDSIDYLFVFFFFLIICTGS